MTRDDRAAFRAFVREHHPDRGGDPEAFRAGLERLRAAPAAPVPVDPRFDAPVVFVADRPLVVRIAVALIRTTRRRARPAPFTHRRDDR